MAFSQARPLQSAQPSSPLAHVFMAPLVDKVDKICENARTDEAAYLDALDSLYDDYAPKRISHRHYHQPIIMTSAQGATLDQVLEAWVKSGLFYCYNLVLLSADSSVLQHPALQQFPEARERLAICNEPASVSHLQGGISHYLFHQEPHVYLATEGNDPALVSAVFNHFLVCSLVDLPWLVSGQNGFHVACDSAMSLAKELVKTLDSVDSDWEVLREIGLQGRETQVSVLMESVLF